jgi:hypothetical protein
MANSNDLQKRLAIYKYDRSENTGGTPVERFLFYKYTYGSLKVITGDLQIDPAPGTVPVTQVEIIIRHDPIIDYNCKIVYDNNTYKIHYIEEITPKGFLRIRAYVYNENQPGNRIE